MRSHTSNYKRMGDSMRITPDRMVGVLGAAPKPAKIWQEQFDYCQEVLEGSLKPIGTR